MKVVNEKNERQLLDWTFEFGARKPLSKFYTIVERSRKYYESYLFLHSRGKKVLEYGCGAGSYAFALAKHDSEVTGIDISDMAINLARARAQREEIGKIAFLVMNAEAMQFADNSFDIVCGTAILHHLHLDRALKDLARILKPEGKAIFMEPMGHNPAINTFRRLTPHLRMADEHPLTVRDLALTRQYFHHVDCTFFHLFSLLAVPFRNCRIFSSLLRTLDNIDRTLFRRIPVLQKLAWQVVIILENPRKE
jgi:ubiquinone/menaquinone biosynthesis C-methylase UbiE